MKRSLLLIALTYGISGLSQNFQDNKVSFSYTQLPTNPIDKQYSTYDVVLIRGWEQSNEDSLNTYQMKVEAAQSQYDSEMDVWKEQKKNIDRNHLSSLAAWEKQQNAGTPSPMPIKPTYPAQPVMQEIFEPQLHEDMLGNQVKQSINLQGYNQGGGGATITLTVKPVSGMNIVETKSGEGAAIKYNYACQYLMPIEIKVESPSQGIILNTILLNEVRSYPMQSYASKYEHELWLLDNRTQFWTDLQKYAREKGLESVNSALNDACGFPTKMWSTEVYTVKKYKEHNYSDLLDAYTLAKQGYDLIIQQRDHSAGKAKLTEAISIWNKALGESNLSDSKARINDNVTAMCYYNIAEAYFWMNDFDNAEVYITKAVNGGKMKFKSAANQLQGRIADFKQRYNANY